MATHPLPQSRQPLPPSFGREFWENYQEFPCNYHVTLRLDGFVDEEVLRQSLQLLPGRHPMLRLGFEFNNDSATLVERHDSGLPFSLLDLCGLPLAKREQELSYCLENAATQILHQDQSPQAFVTLYRMDKWKQVLSWVIHPALASMETIQALIADFSALYECNIQGAAPPPAPLIGDNPGQGRTAGSLSSPASSLLISPDFAPWDKPPLATHSFSCDLPADTCQRLSHLTERMGVPRERAVLAALSCLLARYSGKPRFKIGYLPSTSHKQAPAQAWSQLKVLDIDLTSQPAFREWTASLHSDLITGRSCHKTAEPHVGLVFSWRQAPNAVKLPQLDMQLQAHQVSPAALSITALYNGERLSLLFAYDPKRYRASTIERLSRHLETFLHGAASFPDQPVHQLPMLTIEERTLLRNWQRKAARPMGKAQLVHELVDLLAEQHAERIAVADGPHRLNFGELNKNANQMAWHLRTLGVRRGIPVALVMHPSVDMVVATLGILKAGGMVLPITPESSEQRAARLLGRAGVCFVIGGSWPGAVFEAAGIKRLEMSQLLPELKEYPSTAPRVEVKPLDGALLRFPVMGTLLLSEHSTLVAMIALQSKIIGFSRGEHIVYMTHLESTTWLCEMFAIWNNGGTALLARSGDDESGQPSVSLASRLA